MNIIATTTSQDSVVQDAMLTKEIILVTDIFQFFALTIPEFQDLHTKVELVQLALIVLNQVFILDGQREWQILLLK